MSLYKILIQSILLSILISLFSSRLVFAVTTKIVDFPSTIMDQPFTIIASISGATSGQNYLRVDLYKEGTDNYFGETFNGTDWYAGSDGKLYFPVTIDSTKTGVATVKARTGSPNISEYDTSGNYKMRVRRYTSGGGYTSAEANENAVMISINLPTPTPTSTPSPTPTLTPTLVVTNSPTVTPTKVPTKTPTVISSKNDGTAGSSNSAITDLNGEVLSSSSESSDVNLEDEEKQNVKVESISTSNFNKYLILSGILLLITSCGILVIKSYKRYKENKNDEEF